MALQATRNLFLLLSVVHRVAQSVCCERCGEAIVEKAGATMAPSIQDSEVLRSNPGLPLQSASSHNVSH